MFDNRDIKVKYSELVLKLEKDIGNMENAITNINSIMGNKDCDQETKVFYGKWVSLLENIKKLQEKTLMDIEMNDITQVSH
jgi:uncharacterized protein YfcZ (UPF0381/DUF406 family)